jgi:hypothetical protein
VSDLCVEASVDSPMVDSLPCVIGERVGVVVAERLDVDGMLGFDVKLVGEVEVGIVDALLSLVVAKAHADAAISRRALLAGGTADRACPVVPI